MVEADVGVGLDEQNALACAVDGQLAPLELPQPTGQRVVVHQRLSDGIPEHRRRVVVPAEVAPEEVDDRSSYPH